MHACVAVMMLQMLISEMLPEAGNKSFSSFATAGKGMIEPISVSAKDSNHCTKSLPNQHRWKFRALPVSMLRYPNKWTVVRKRAAMD